MLIETDNLIVVVVDEMVVESDRIVGILAAIEEKRSLAMLSSLCNCDCLCW